MRALSIRSILIQVCIVSVAILPGRIGAEERLLEAFRIEITQPQYSSKAGHVWNCLTAALLKSACRQSVPLIIFGQPTLAQIQMHAQVSRSNIYTVEVYATFDQPGRWYRASGLPRNARSLVLNVEGSLAREIRFDYRGHEPGRAVTDLLNRPSPNESLSLKISPIAAR
jgi:hypothetical protein